MYFDPNRNLNTGKFQLRELKAATGLMTLLGSGWVMGAFMTIPDRHAQVTVQYMFIILNATQVCDIHTTIQSQYSICTT